METTNTLAWTQVSEIELIYKTKVKASDRPHITSSHDAYKLFKQTWDEDKIEFVEQFKIMLLNRARKVLGIYEFSTGSIAGTIADPKLVFAAALKASASYIILCHNHPSGNLKASNADIILTNKLIEAGKFLELPIEDHLIIANDDGYYSFADEGLL